MGADVKLIFWITIFNLAAVVFVEGNFCTTVVSRTISCRVPNGTETFTKMLPRWCNANAVSGLRPGAKCARIGERTKYVTTYKTVSDVQYKCCPGFVGTNCDMECFNCTTLHLLEQRIQRLEQRLRNVNPNATRQRLAGGSQGVLRPGPADTSHVPGFNGRRRPINGGGVRPLNGSGNETRHNQLGNGRNGQRRSSTTTVTPIGEFVEVENGNNQGISSYGHKAPICSCPTGPAGPPGPPGPAGISGISGVDGRNGLDGLKGDRGDSGLAGIPGIPGIPGFKGEKGENGLDGLPGTNGEPGRHGVNGAEGPEGRAGRSGTDGLPGLPGLDGLPGISGPLGPPGPRGETGLPGIPGISGEPGQPGHQGPQGEVGPVGSTGPAGLPGSPGKQGPAGPAGVGRGRTMMEGSGSAPDDEDDGPGKPGPPGPPGPIGPVGPVGPEGPAGKDGSAGPEGPKGEPGLTGLPGQKGVQGDGLVIDADEVSTTAAGSQEPVLQLLQIITDLKLAVQDLQKRIGELETGRKSEPYPDPLLILTPQTVEKEPEIGPEPLIELPSRLPETSTKRSEPALTTPAAEDSNLDTVPEVGDPTSGSETGFASVQVSTTETVELDNEIDVGIADTVTETAVSAAEDEEEEEEDDEDYEDEEIDLNADEIVTPTRGVPATPSRATVAPTPAGGSPLEEDEEEEDEEEDDDYYDENAKRKKRKVAKEEIRRLEKMKKFQQKLEQHISRSRG